MTPDVFDFILGSLEVTDRNIEVAEGHHVTENQKWQFQIKMCDDNRNKFICNISQHNFGTRYMRHNNLHCYTNEFRT